MANAKLYQHNWQTIGTAKTIEDQVQQKINEFKSKNIEYAWLETFKSLVQMTAETFKIFHRLYVFAIETINKIENDKYVLNNITYRLPGYTTFDTINSTAQRLYLATSGNINDIQRFLNHIIENELPLIIKLDSHPKDLFLVELIFLENAYAKLSTRKGLLAAMEADIKHEQFEDYIIKVNKLLDDDYTDTETYFQNFDKLMSNYNTLVPMIESDVISIIARHAVFIKELNDLFKIPRSSSSSLGQKPLDAKNIGQLITPLGEKIIKSQRDTSVPREFLNLLYQLRIFLWKMFDIYVDINDFYSKRPSMDSFNGVDSAKNAKAIFNKLETLLTTILDSIFKMHDPMLKHLNQPSSRVTKALKTANDFADEATILARKIHQQIYNNVPPKSIKDSNIEKEFIAETEKFCFRIQQTQRYKWFNFPIKTLLWDLQRSIGGHQRKISTVREKLRFLISQYNDLYTFFDTIIESYVNPDFQIKQSVKKVDGSEFSIPPSYVCDALWFDRAQVADNIREIRDWLNSIKILQNTIYSATELRYVMWEKFNESALSNSVSKAVDDLNKLYKEMLSIFMEAFKNSYEYFLVLGLKAVVDIDFVTESKALNYINANFNLECVVIPNLRNCIGLVRFAVLNIKGKITEIKAAQQKILNEAVAAIQNWNRI